MRIFARAAGSLSLVLLAPPATAGGDEAHVEPVGSGTPGTAGVPTLSIEGAPVLGLPFAWRVDGGLPLGFGALFFSANESPLPLPLFGATAYPTLPLFTESFALDADGSAGGIFSVPAVPASICGAQLVAQALVVDPGAQGGASFTAGLRTTFGDPAGVDLDWQVEVALESPGADWFDMTDVDGDGELDFLALTGSTNGIQTALGDGTGAFGPSTFSPAGTNPQVGQAADFDGDGNLDVASGDGAAAGLVVSLGAGDGTFAPPSTSLFANLNLTTGIDAGDVDADGDLDLFLISDASGKLHRFLGAGDGTFTKAGTYPLGMGHAHGMEIVDLDSDGVLDAAVTGSIKFTGTLSWYAGDGAGGFGAGTPLSFSATSGRGLVATDLDGNGTVDLAVSKSITINFVTTGGISVHSGDGLGGFTETDSVPTPKSLDELLSADVDGDGDPDLVSERTFTALSIFRNQGSGTYGSEEVVPMVESWVRGAVARDLDGDGAVDLFATSGQRVMMLRADAPGQFDAPFALDTPDSLWEHGLGDLDGDGHLDAVHLANVPGTGRALSVRVGGGDGTLAAGVVHYPITDFHFDLTLADLDGDGEVDASVLIGGDELQVFLGNGGGGLGAPLSSPVESGALTYALGDLNVDGLLDAASLTSQVQSVFQYTNDGDGTFTFAQARPVAMGPNVVRIADMNGNGLPEVIVNCEVHRQIQVLNGLGNGKTGVKEFLTTVDGAETLTIADLDFDGALDVLIDQDSGMVLHRGVGDNSLAPGIAATPTADTGPYSLGDLNSDGVPELILLDGGCQIFPGRGDGTFGAPEITSSFGAGLSHFSRPTLAADMSSDGLVDLVILGSTGSAPEVAIVLRRDDG